MGDKVTLPPKGLRPLPPGGQPSWGGPARADEVTRPPTGLRPLPPGGQPTWGGPAWADLWLRVRRLFGLNRSTSGFDQVLADWDTEERSGRSRPALRRELLHPMRGWREEARASQPNDAQALRTGRPLPSRTVVK